jgi:L-amino acid N-acyltransferase YncA
MATSRDWDMPTFELLDPEQFQKRERKGRGERGERGGRGRRGRGGRDSNVVSAHEILASMAADTAPPSAPATASPPKERAETQPSVMADKPDSGDDGEPAGYAYAAPFRDRPAYRFACEDSIYIRHDRRGQGIGKALLVHTLGVALELRDQAGCVGIVADVKPGAVPFYASLGFEPVEGVRGGLLHGGPAPMFLPLDAVAAAL